MCGDTIQFTHSWTQFPEFPSIQHIIYSITTYKQIPCVNSITILIEIPYKIYFFQFVVYPIDGSIIIFILYAQQFLITFLIVINAFNRENQIIEKYLIMRIFYQNFQKIFKCISDIRIC
ncbi:hypothetical protein pb186bvf_001473 [Paramecium bursaria]